MYLSFYLSIYQSIYLSICLSICKFENENLTTSEAQQFFETSSVFERENVKNCETSLWSSWQHQKRSNSARPSQFTSKPARSLPKCSGEIPKCFLIPVTKNKMKILLVISLKSCWVNQQFLFPTLISSPTWATRADASGRCTRSRAKSSSTSTH